VKLRSISITAFLFLGAAINWAGETLWDIFAEGDGPGPIIRVDSFYLERYGMDNEHYHLVIRCGPRVWRTSHHLDDFQVRAMSEYLGAVWKEKGRGWDTSETLTPSSPENSYWTWMDGDTIWDLEEIPPLIPSGSPLPEDK
jgi:hypothetical protein